jgi:hypothetical protein
MQLEIIVKEINHPSDTALKQFNQHVFETLQKYRPQDGAERERGEAS